MGETDKPRGFNWAAKKHWGWNSFQKTCSSSSSAMFTAGNMTYMRKRKKERQAAKRAMARENAMLDALEKEREEQEAVVNENDDEPVEFYDVCNNGGKPKRRTYTTD